MTIGSSRAWRRRRRVVFFVARLRRHPFRAALACPALLPRHA